MYVYMVAISPITTNYDGTAFQHKQKEYAKDPMMKMPVRLAAFTNEVGVALQPVIGAKAMTASWIPALCYMGAAIFAPKVQGKEQNNEGVAKRAAFHLTASAVLPTIAATAGKKVTKAILDQKFGAEAVATALQTKGFNKIKGLKALGGLTALAVLIKPIDKFTEEVVVKKVVEPLYHKFAKTEGGTKAA
jgi:hypothetical protein